MYDIQGVFIHAYAHIRTRRDTQKHTNNMNTYTQSLWMMEDATAIRAPAQKRDKDREILQFALCPCLSTRLPRHFCMEPKTSAVGSPPILTLCALKPKLQETTISSWFTSHSDTQCECPIVCSRGEQGYPGPDA